MLVRFLRDYQGAFTREVFYAAGTEIDLEEGAAIVAEGAAEAVAAPVVREESSKLEEKPAKGRKA